MMTVLYSYKRPYISYQPLHTHQVLIHLLSVRSLRTRPIRTLHRAPQNSPLLPPYSFLMLPLPSRLPQSNNIHFPHTKLIHLLNHDWPYFLLSHRFSLNIAKTRLPGALCFDLPKHRSRGRRGSCLFLPAEFARSSSREPRRHRLCA